MSRKKICFIVSSPMTANVFLNNHFEILKDKYEIHLVANLQSFDFNLPYTYVLLKDIKINRSISIISDIVSIFQLFFFLRRNNFYSIHSITPKAGMIAMIAGKLANVKHRIHIFTGQVWYTKKGLIRSVLIAIDRLIVLFSTKILVDSKAQAQFLVNHNIIRENGYLILGNGSISGVDLTRFSFNPQIRCKIRNELGLTDSQIVLCFLGRITQDKGIFDLVYAFEKILKSKNDVVLLLVGEEEDLILNKIEKRIPKEHFRYIKHTSVPEEVLQAADIFCLPSYREGFGNSIIEASALKLPVICSNTYGLLDTIIESETGFRHEVGNIDEIYMHMLSLIENNSLRSRMGVCGRQYVEDYFSSDFVSSQWLKFYDNL